MVQVARGEIVLTTVVRGLGDARRAIDQNLQKISGRQSYYAGFIQARMGQMALAMSAAMMGFVGSSVKAFAEFDQAMQNTASVTQATSKEIEMLAVKAKELGIAGPIAATEVGKAMYFMASGGLEASEIMQAAEPIWKLAVATQTDMKQVALSVMTTMKAFGAQFDDTTHFAQVFAAGITNSQLTMQTLAQTMKMLGPIAHQLGMSIEEVVGVSALLADMNIRAGMSGRAQRRMLQGTIKDTKGTRDVLEDLGLKMRDMDVKTLGFVQVFKKLANAGADVGDMFKLFGLRAAPAAAGVASLAKEQGFITKSLQDYIDMVSDTTRLEVARAKQMKGLDNQIKMTENSLKNLMLTYGAIWGDAMRPFLTLTRKILDGLSALPEPIQRLIALLVPLTASILALSGVWLILSGIMIQSMLNWKQFGGFIAGTMSKLLIGIKKLSLALIAQNVVLGVNGQFYLKGARGAITMAKAQSLLLPGLMSILGTMISIVAYGALLATSFIAITIALGMLDARIKTVLMNKGGIKTVFQNTIKFIKDKVDALLRWADAHPILARFLGISQLRNVSGMINAVWDPVKKTIVGAAEKGTMAWEQFVENLRQGMDMSKDIWIESFGEMRDFLIEMFPQMSDEVDKFFAKLNRKNPEAAEKAKTVWGEVFAQIKEEGFSTGESFDTWIKGVEDAWVDTVKGLIDGTKTWKDVWNSILDDALNTFIKGFIHQMLTSWGAGLAEMLGMWHEAQGSLFGGGSKNPWGNWLGLFGSLIGMGGGISTGTGSVGGASGMGTGFTSGFASGIGSAEGGIFNKPSLRLIGEAGPEAVVPLDRLATGGQDREITIVNVVDSSFVHRALVQSPNTVINIINDDIMKNGITRHTIKQKAT